MLRARILLVEDDLAVGKVLARQLEGDRHTVLRAASATEAIHFIEYSREAFDLAIVDAVLPAPGSTAVAEALRDAMPTLRVLVISALDENVVRRSSLVTTLEHEPRLRFLGKPFSLATFSACVAELLAHPDEIIEIATGEWQARDHGG
ncbi:MAG TPA: response regulator [Gemmatimonadaceae bacterium]